MQTKKSWPFTSFYNKKDSISWANYSSHIVSLFKSVLRMGPTPNRTKIATKKIDNLKQTKPNRSIIKREKSHKTHYFIRAQIFKPNGLNSFFVFASCIYSRDSRTLPSPPKWFPSFRENNPPFRDPARGHDTAGKWMGFAISICGIGLGGVQWVFSLFYFFHIYD